MRWIWMALLCACTVYAAPTPPADRSAPPPMAVKADPVQWPARGSLRAPVVEVPEDHVKQTVFVVAGHGTRTNEGNLGAWCTREQDFTLRAATNLARMLDATGQFDAVEARTGDQRPSYRSRLRHLERVGATAMIELHSDARADRMTPHAISMDGETCWRDDGEPGFTILVADREGTAELIEDRLALARALGLALADAGFTPWVGDNYQGLYEADDVPGVWRDRRRLFMLREPTVPSVLIETHNGKDGRETLRWEEPATHDAFGRAVLSGLLSFYER